MADTLSFEGLQPEIFTGELTWIEFLEAFSQVIEENIRSPIKEIEDIREIIESTDPVIISNTIKQMGFDIPKDIIAHNSDRLARSIYMLPLFHETSGTSDFTKAVSFVLGRQVDVTTLYTRDYAHFYPEPHGALNIDGGEWYKSTHISLGMESIPSDARIITAENQTIKDRLLDAFYEFAPINLVVSDFYYIINAYQNIGISGTVHIETDKMITVGEGTCNDKTIIIEGPTVVREGTSHRYKLGFSSCAYSGPVLPGMPFFFLGPNGVNRGDEVEMYALAHEPLGNTSSPQKLDVDITSNNYGYFCIPVELGGVTFTDTALNIPGGWDGASWPADGSIGTSVGPVRITRTLSGEDSEWLLYRTDFPAIGQYEYEIKFDTIDVPSSGTIAVGKVIPTYDAVWTTNKGGYVSFGNRGEVSFGRVSVNTPVRLSAIHNGTEAHLDVIIETYNDDIVALEIVGPSVLLQNSTTLYAVNGIFSDGQKAPVDATLSVVSQHAVATNNEITVFRPKRDIDVFVTAEYTSSAGVHVVASKVITLKAVSSSVTLTGLTIEIDPTPTPQSLSSATVAVPDVVDELVVGDERKFRAIASFSDGTTKEVLPLWSSNSTALDVATDGQAVARQTVGPLSVEVGAEYAFNGSRVKANKAVSVKNEANKIERLSIIGSSRVVELSRSQFAAIAVWSDGTSVPVLASWMSNAFSIDQHGVFEAGSVDKPKNVVITAKVGEIVTSAVIVVYDTPRVLQHINIVGPDNVREGVVAQYTAYAHYSDNTDVEITPQWSFAYGRNEAVTIDSEGKLTFDLSRTEGTPGSAIVEIQARFDIGTETKTQTKPIVLVPDTPLITSLLISGPTEVYEGERIYLSASAVYADGSLDDDVLPLWDVQSFDPVNIPDVAADVVSPGILQGRSVEVDTKVVVLARFFKEIAEHIVVVKNKPELSPDVPQSSRIHGPPVFLSSQTGSYAHLIQFNGICGEQAVSSTWSIDVSPEIAVIDDDGFLHSVNGVGLPITITSIYDCGGYTVEDSIVVTIVSENSSLNSIDVHGPSHVLTDSITPYTAELFRQGSSQGELISDVNWSVVGAPPGVSINGAGELFIGTSVPDGSTFNVKAGFSEGFDSVEGSTTVAVTRLLPLYGTGPIAVNTDNEIAGHLTNELPSTASGQLISLDVKPGTYGYFAYPAALGLATFVSQDGSAGSGVIGGWDGAAWPNDGSIGTTTGPLTVSRTINGIQSSWFVYRTDSTSLGNVTYQVLFL